MLTGPLLLLPRATPAQEVGTIVTIAGGGGFSGDGGPATEASLWFPTDVAVDAHGDLFISEMGNADAPQANSRVRKVEPSGIITTVAGTGVAGLVGDGGLATEAALRGVMGISLDGAGNLLLEDTDNHRVRKVDEQVSSPRLQARRSRASEATGAPPLRPGCSFPEVWPWTLPATYLSCDAENQRVWKVDLQGTITTVAGSGAVGFDKGGFSGDGGSAKLSSTGPAAWSWTPRAKC